MKLLNSIKTLYVGMVVVLIMPLFASAAFINPSTNPHEPLKFLDVTATNQSKQGWLGLGFAPGGLYQPFATLEVKGTTIVQEAFHAIGSAWGPKFIIGATPVTLPSLLSNTNKLTVDQSFIRASSLAGNGERRACTGSDGKFIECTSIGNNGSQLPPPGNPVVVNQSAYCGSAANTLATVPPSSLCAAGSIVLGPTTPGAGGSYHWVCYSTTDEATAQCSTSPLPPACGDAAHVATTVTPTSNLCFSGNVTGGVSGGVNGVYSWTCADGGVNPPVTCYTPANNIVPSMPTGCFALRSAASNDTAVLTCANENGNATATSYRLQAYSVDGSGNWTNAIGDAPYETIQAINATPGNSSLGTWANNIGQVLPKAVFFSSYTNSNGPGGFNSQGNFPYIWQVAGCNSAGCSAYSSEKIYPANFYRDDGASMYGAYDGNTQGDISFIKSDSAGHVKFTWPVAADPKVRLLYSDVYIYRCTLPDCHGPWYPGAVNLFEEVDINNTLAHGQVFCNTTVCNTTLNDPSTTGDEYMITFGKDLYNDNLYGPKQVSASENPILSGYVSGWDQFSPWQIANY